MGYRFDINGIEIFMNTGCEYFIREISNCNVNVAEKTKQRTLLVTLRFSKLKKQKSR